MVRSTGRRSKRGHGAIREVVGTAPYVAAQALLTRGDAVRGVLVRGIDPAAEPACPTWRPRCAASR